MARKRTAAPTQPALFDVKTTTAPCVPAIRDAVNKWRADGYPGATETSRRLLNYWFETDHRMGDGRKFK
jgi:type III restriction enzyme